MRARLRRLLLRLIRAANLLATGLAIRLVRWTGKAPYYVHPKHLVGDTVGHGWYVTALRPDDVVLDVGCGNGFHTIRAAAHARYVIGFDPDRPQVRVGADLARRRRVGNVAFLAASAENTFPFRDGTFDAVLLLDVLEHLTAREAALGEIRRVLCPGGRLMLSAPNADTRWKRRLRAAGLFPYADADHKIEYTPQALALEVGRCGFTAAGPLQPIVYDTPWAGAIDLIGGLSLRLYRRLLHWKIAMARRRPEDSTGFRAVWVRS